MDKTTPSEKQQLRHQAASSYTEEQARLLFAMRDMVKWEVTREVTRQLKEMFESTE